MDLFKRMAICVLQNKEAAGLDEIYMYLPEKDLSWVLGLWKWTLRSTNEFPHSCYEPEEWGVSEEISRFIPLQMDGVIKWAMHYVSVHMHNKKIETFSIFFCHHLKNCNLLCTSSLSDHPLLRLFPRLHSIWLHSPHCMNKKKWIWSPVNTASLTFTHSGWLFTA